MNNPAVVEIIYVSCNLQAQFDTSCKQCFQYFTESPAVSKVHSLAQLHLLTSVFRRYHVAGIHSEVDFFQPRIDLYYNDKLLELNTTLEKFISGNLISLFCLVSFIRYPWNQQVSRLREILSCDLSPRGLSMLGKNHKNKSAITQILFLEFHSKVKVISYLKRCP